MNNPRWGALGVALSAEDIAAIANAVRDATGHRFTDLPITSEAVSRAVSGGAR